MSASRRVGPRNLDGSLLRQRDGVPCRLNRSADRDPNFARFLGKVSVAIIDTDGKLLISLMISGKREGSWVVLAVGGTGATARS
jgi:hypothetical protein